MCLAHFFIQKEELECLTLLSTIFQLYRGGKFLLVEQTGIPVENLRPARRQTLSYNVVSSTHRLRWINIRTHNVSVDRH